MNPGPPVRRRGLIGLALAGASPAASAQSPAAASVAAVAPRCEWLVDPSGIDAAAPRLSWELAAARPDARGAAQSAYLIEVASSIELLTAGASDLWNSGRVFSREQLVAYAGAPLASGRRCWWRATVWDEAGRKSEPGAVGFWSMGLLRPEDWRAKWICLDDAPSPPLLDAPWIGFDGDLRGPDPHRYFRREVMFPSGAGPGQAALTVAADSGAAVSVNGAWAGPADGWAEARRIELPALPAGPVVIAVTVSPREGGDDPPALAARLDATLLDGRTTTFSTGAGWRVCDWAPKGWKMPGFDDSAWRPARVLGSGAGTRWGDVPAPAVASGPAVWLRKEFVLDAPAAHAAAHLSGLGWSLLRVNGRRVGDAALSPGLTDYDKRVLWVTHDVTALLRPGANAVGVMLGNGRFRAPRPEARSYGSPRLLLQIEIEHADGRRSRVESGPGWRATDAGPVRANNEYDGETYDARQEMPGWAEPGFDDRAWRRAAAATPPSGRLAASASEPSRVLAVLPPVSMTQAEPGRTIVDFGQTVAGVCRLILDLPSGAEVVVRHAERLRDGRLDVANLRGALATDRYVSRGEGEAEWQPSLTTHGFRYAEVAGLPEPLDARAISACVIGDDLRRTGAFACSDPLLNRLHEAVAWTVRANCRSIRTDCPQRDERQGWLGDPGEEAAGEAYLFGNAAFYAKWMRDVADAQGADGRLPDVAPPYVTTGKEDVSLPAAFVAIPGTLLDHYGDARTLADCLPAMLRWLDRLLARVEDGVIRDDAYGDWGAPPEDRRLTHPADPARDTPGPLIATAFLIRCLDRVSGYAGRLGRAADAARTAEAARVLRAGFHARFFDQGAGWYGNGGATSCILPLAFGLVPEAARAAVTARLVAALDGGDGPRPAFGLVGAQFVYRVLSAAGRDDIAYAMASRTRYPSFGYMLERGATTLWELWNGDTAPPEMSSGAHTMLMGDLPAWLYEHLAGIAPDPERPGFAHALLRPHVTGDLTWARASLLTPRGRLACGWRLDGARLSVGIEVPPNAEATFQPPPGSEGRLTEGGSDAAASEGVRPAPDGFRLASGRYAFETVWRRRAS